MKELSTHKNILKMKTLIKKSVIVFATGLLMSLTAKAGGIEPSKSILISDATKTIKEHVKFPNLLLNYSRQEKVNVVFTVNDEGHVNLVIANTTNDVLKKSIETQFSKLVLKQLKANNAYSIQFNFKTI